jgi:type I restriction enzyme, S subunit
LRAGWVRRPLGAITTKIGSGATPRGGETAYQREGISLIRSLNVHDTGFRSKDLAFIDALQAADLSNVIVQVDDVLLNITGASVARCCTVPNDVLPARVNQHVSILRPIKSIIGSRFLSLLLISPDFKGRLLQDGAAGSTRQALTKAQLESFEVEFPISTTEQERIVAILYGALDDIATAKANVEESLQNISSFFTSAVSSLLQSQPGSESKSIADIAIVFDGPHATPKTVSEGPVFLGISALRNGSVILEETRHVTPKDFERWTRRVAPKANDFVFSYETRLGEAALIPEGLTCCLGRRMGLARLDETRVDPRYFLHLYRSASFQNFLRTKTIRGATVDRISIKEFPSFPVSLPTLLRQKETVEKLEMLRLKTDQLIGSFRRKLSAFDELKQSLRHQAFTGKL